MRGKRRRVLCYTKNDRIDFRKRGLRLASYVNKSAWMAKSSPTRIL